MVGFAIGEGVWLPPPGVAGGASGWNPLNASSWVGVVPAPWLGVDPPGVAGDFFLIRTGYENQIRKFQPNSIQKNQLTFSSLRVVFNVGFLESSCRSVYHGGGVRLFVKGI